MLMIIISKLGETALAQMISPIATLHFSVPYHVVCLSTLSYVVCHIMCIVLKRSGIGTWQVHLRGSVTHCVRWASWPPKRRGDLRVEPKPKRANCFHLTKNDDLSFSMQVIAAIPRLTKSP